MPPIDFTRRTALYRLYGDLEQLLYVGIAFDPAARWKHHAIFKSWWPDVARKDVEWHATRTLALAAEKEVIHHERPLHNAKGNGKCRIMPAARRTAAMDNRLVRISDVDWEELGQHVGERHRATVIRDFIAWYLHRPGVKRIQRPDLADWADQQS